MQVLEELVERAEWAPAHAHAKGEFRCASCGYGVVVSKILPRCPMCRERVWERVAWRPFSGRTMS
jgi:rubrerythrin